MRCAVLSKGLESVAESTSIEVGQEAHEEQLPETFRVHQVARRFNLFSHDHLVKQVFILARQSNIATGIMAGVERRSCSFLLYAGHIVNLSLYLLSLFRQIGSKSEADREEDKDSPHIGQLSHHRGDSVSHFRSEKSYLVTRDIRLNVVRIH